MDAIGAGEVVVPTNKNPLYSSLISVEEEPAGGKQNNNTVASGEEQELSRTERMASGQLSEREQQLVRLLLSDLHERQVAIGWANQVKSKGKKRSKSK